MNKHQLLKLFLSLEKNSEKGLTLIELIVALVMSGIVLTMAASGFINILRANQDVESKTVTSANLQRALAFIQEDIKQSKSVVKDTCPSGSPTNVTATASSTDCLKITIPNAGSLVDFYYGFDDISVGNQIFLKPGILKRYDGTKWEVVMDGLVNTTPSTTCNSKLGSATGVGPHGMGGFRFCVELDKKRLAQVFLFAQVNNGEPISANVITFARSQ